MSGDAKANREPAIARWGRGVEILKERGSAAQSICESRMVIEGEVVCSPSSILPQDPRKLLYNRTVVDVVAWPIDNLLSLNDPRTSLVAYCRYSAGHVKHRMHVLGEGSQLLPKSNKASRQRAPTRGMRYWSSSFGDATTMQLKQIASQRQQ